RAVEIDDAAVARVARVDLAARDADDPHIGSDLAEGGAEQRFLAADVDRDDARLGLRSQQQAPQKSEYGERSGLALHALPPEDICARVAQTRRKANALSLDPFGTATGRC